MKEPDDKTFNKEEMLSLMIKILEKNGYKKLREREVYGYNYF